VRRDVCVSTFIPLPPLTTASPLEKKKTRTRIEELAGGAGHDFF
jgi:hypothetical protein